MFSCPASTVAKLPARCSVNIQKRRRSTCQAMPITRCSAAECSKREPYSSKSRSHRLSFRRRLGKFWMAFSRAQPPSRRPCVPPNTSQHVQRFSPGFASAKFASTTCLASRRRESIIGTHVLLQWRPHTPCDTPDTGDVLCRKQLADRGGRAQTY